MPRSRKPLEAAKLEGRDLHDPQRFRGRREPRQSEGAGSPPAWMTPDECAVWNEYLDEVPWLKRSHRRILALAVRLSAKMGRREELGISEMNTLRLCLSQLGATPVDSTKVRVDDEDDPDDEIERTYFSNEYFRN